MQKGEFQGVIQEAARIQEKSANNLYCTNRMSLENSFYATRDSIDTTMMEVTRR